MHTRRSMAGFLGSWQERVGGFFILVVGHLAVINGYGCPATRAVRGRVASRRPSP